jgi:hypothetical protein
VWSANLSLFLGRGSIRARLTLASSVRLEILMCPFVKTAALGAGLLILSLDVSGQKLSIGIVGGWALTDDYRGAGTTTDLLNTPDFSTTATTVITTGSHDFAIGPKLELAITRNFSFEVDALHRNRQWSATTSLSPPVDFGYGPVSSSAFRVTDSAWAVPLLVKYRLPAFRTNAFGRAFVEAGPALRPWLYGGGADRAGFTAGAGFQVHRRGLNLEPTIRYTRWGAAKSTYPGVSSISDQLEFLIGVGGGATSGRPSVFGQKLSIGAVGGFGLSGDFPAKEGYASARSKSVGVMVESGLYKRLSLEVDGLYRPLILSEGQRATVLTWEFPVLAKYRFSTHGVRPFVELGPSFRAAGNLSGTNPSRYGVASGAGVETRTRWLTIAPAFRFTRWTADPAGDPDGPHTFALRNQAELLVGFSF